MKIYLLIMLIGTLLAAVHFTSAPERQSENASATATAAQAGLQRSQIAPSGHRERQYPFPARISCTCLLGTPDSSLSSTARMDLQSAPARP